MSTELQRLWKGLHLIIKNIIDLIYSIRLGPNTEPNVIKSWLKKGYFCLVRLLLDSTTVLEGRDGGMSTALSPTSLHGQGMGFIV